MVWRFLDGSISISLSMLLAVSLNSCAFCEGLPILGFLRELTNREDGVIIVATLSLFPTTVALYGGFRVFFAAKEAAERKAKAREERAAARGLKRGLEQGLERGLEQGRQEERDRIATLLKEHNVQIPAEIALSLNGDSE